uniref:Uncharacterized protein n=1 Tax=uncultured gamma proteobacterium EB750_07C09 TaxID=710974 RepID=E0Y320_9GAMM|nr:hypothetical protein [uncultured gamma proteobacterium EB750_07C09]
MNQLRSKRPTLQVNKCTRSAKLIFPYLIENTVIKFKNFPSLNHYIDIIKKCNIIKRVTFNSNNVTK